MPHDIPDIVFQAGEQDFFGGGRRVPVIFPVFLKKPYGRLIVPDQRVVAHSDPMIPGEGKQCVHPGKVHGGVTRIPLRERRVKVQYRVRLHLIVSGDGAEVTADDLCQFRIRDEAAAEGCADPEIRFVGFAEGRRMKHAVHGNHLLADSSISKRNDALQEACGIRTNTEKQTKKL